MSICLSVCPSVCREDYEESNGRKIEITEMELENLERVEAKIKVPKQIKVLGIRESKTRILFMHPGADTISRPRSRDS